MEASSEPSEEELNPYSIFPQPEHNFKVINHCLFILSPVYEGFFALLFVLSSFILLRSGCIRT